MTVMTCVLVFRLNPNESDYRWITNIAFLGGIATGAVLLSRAKWWQIALVAVVVLTMFMVMMSQTE